MGAIMARQAARVVQGVQQPRLADGEYRAAGSLVLQEGRRGQGAGIEMLLRHIQSHPGQLLLQLTGRVAAVVGQEQVLLLFIVQPLDELRHPRQNAVAVVDDAVHVADKACFLVEVDKVFRHNGPSRLLLLPVYHSAAALSIRRT